MEISNWTRKKTILTLRWFLVITISYMVIFGVSFPESFTLEIFLVLFLIATNVLLYFLPRRFFDSRGLDYFLLVFDTILVSAGLFLSGKASSDLYLVYFLVILLSSLGKNLQRLLASAVFVTCAYAALLALTGPGALINDSAIMIRIPFIIVLSLFYGYLMEQERGRKHRVRRLEKENRELGVLLVITRTISSTFDTREVLNCLVNKIEEFLDVERCSVVYIRDGEEVAYVIASQDDPDIEGFEIDLVEYPEIKRAIDTGDSIVVNDALSDPNVGEVGKKLREAGINSLMVVPIAHGDETFGTLLLRTARVKGGFNHQEMQFCQIIANATANALKNAQLFEELQRRAITDGLTEMYNYRFFQEQFRIESERAKRSGKPLSILMIDIDNFKWINDYHGHAVGDKAIRFIAKKLKAQSRDADIVARYGGDEFVWLLTDTDLDVALEAANRFRKSVSSDSFDVTGFLSVSIGASSFPTDTPSVSRLLHRADRAMYLSKVEGGNRVRSVQNKGNSEILDWGEA
jgi:two-component system cell cycle response regulator